MNATSTTPKTSVQTSSTPPPNRNGRLGSLAGLVGLLGLLGLLGWVALLAGCDTQQDPCGVLIVPASAIPVDQCPVTEMSSADLELRIDPVMLKNATFDKTTYKYHDKATGKVVSPLAVTPAANVKLNLWPLWNGLEPSVCRSCVSVCDCKQITASAPRCGSVLGNRHMPPGVVPNHRPASCAWQEGLPPGTVRCVQGQCVLTPASAEQPSR